MELREMAGFRISKNGLRDLCKEEKEGECHWLRLVTYYPELFWLLKKDVTQTGSEPVVSS